MRLSIIIPVYNVEPWLSRCVESVLSQDYQDYEIILIDDGSTDGSGAICDAYAAKYPFIQVLHKPNGGASTARNVGLDLASGEYIGFIDSDDTILPGCLRQFDSLFDRQYDILRGKPAMRDTHGVEHPPESEIPSGEHSGESFVSSASTGRHVLIGAVNYLYRRDFVEAHRLRFYPGILHEDELWTPLALLAAESVYVADIPYYYYLERVGSIQRSDNRGKRALSTMTVCRELNAAYVKYPRSRVKWLQDRMSMLYLRDIPYVPDRQAYISEFGRLFPLKNAMSLHERGKALLFAASPSLYCRLIKWKNRGKYGALCDSHCT